MICKYCGAPVEANEEVCKYCGKMTEHGEHMLEERKRLEQEEKKRHALDNLPVFKYVSMTFMIFVYVITLGAYSPYWYATRIASFNGLNTSKKFPAWAAGIFGVAWCISFISPGSAESFAVIGEFSQEIFNYAMGIAFTASIYLAFISRNILQEYATKFMEKNIAVGSIAPSGIMLVCFGPVYLQHCINKMISMKILAPKI